MSHSRARVYWGGKMSKVGAEVPRMWKAVDVCFKDIEQADLSASPDMSGGWVK